MKCLPSHTQENGGKGEKYVYTCGRTVGKGARDEGEGRAEERAPSVGGSTSAPVLRIILPHLSGKVRIWPALPKHLKRFRNTVSKPLDNSG